MINTAAVLGVVVLAVAAARGIALAIDCSAPGRRGPMVAWILIWSAVGAIGLPVATLTLLAAGWRAIEWLNRLNGTPI
jgi:hypothetical protein